MIGAICAAGWKGYIQAALSKKEWGAKLPEALIPLGSGTILSRAVEQLKGVGATKVFVGVGVPGKSSPTYERWLAHGGYDRSRTFEVEVGADIWTQERLDYVESLGCIAVPMPDFELTRASYTTGKLLERIVLEDFDTILVTMGDYVMSKGFLEDILKLKAPCMWRHGHLGWLLDRPAAEFLSVWLAVKGNPTHLRENLYVLGEHGIAIEEGFSKEFFIEAEKPGTYKEAQRGAKKWQ